MQIALVYDRVNKWGGAERVLLALHKLFPNAPLFTAVYAPSKAKWAKIFPNVIPSFLQKLPLMQNKHELLGTFTPIAFESFDLSGFDLVISVTSESAKGVLTKPPTKHICYMLTPNRYLWSGFELYFKNPVLRFISRPVVAYLKRWDRIAANRPDKLIAISTEVGKRIKKYYKRDSEIVYPPVNTSILYSIFKNRPRKNFYLVVSRLVAYKKVDLAIRTFNKLGLPLYIIGTGNQERQLKRLAKANIKFLGEVGDEKLNYYYSRCRALIFPQEEDFGLVAVEAQAHGAPVVAYGAGGALDTVIDGVTGILFPRQEVDSMVEAIAQFKRTEFDRSRLVANAKRFSNEIFEKKFLKAVTE